MSCTMQYKDYIGSIEFNEADSIFYGKVMGVRALISYEGSSALELSTDFHSAVDEYLEECKQLDREPEKSYKGSFNVRISPELHKKAVIQALAKQMTLNSFVEQALQKAVTM